MNGDREEFIESEVPRFERSCFDSACPFSRIGQGEIGGKAHGLVTADRIIRSEFGETSESRIDVRIPRFVILATDVFEAFLERNELDESMLSDLTDDRIAHRFQRAEFPMDTVGDLRAIAEVVKSPLAVRSSSLLEDALFHPFAGVYETKMTPNNQHDPGERFRKLIEAIKLVYASTFFEAARTYVQAIGKSIRDERMAVIIQEVVGLRHDDRFYPSLSGVCRSYNFYPTGGATSEEGVVDLALGLGKTIVDGGLAWFYSPSLPRISPPYSSVGDLMRLTQRKFWAVNVGKAPSYDPTAETEYLVESELDVADYDGALTQVASTYRAESDRLSPGVGPDGPRVINFAPLLVLESYPLNEVLVRLLAASERVIGQPVEIEFAMNFPAGRDAPPAELGFLQVRPMVVSTECISIEDDELVRDDLLLSSTRVMGNGNLEVIRDVVYVKPEPFESRHTMAIASQLERINRPLLTEDRPYLLIGFGRWGSSDPWLGIPVNWGQICGAKVIVEATLPTMAVEASQGSHFFHNISSFQVSYFTVSHNAEKGIDWSWLDAQEVIEDEEFVRHARLKKPLLVKVDGRSSHGAIWHPE
jgi:hypothetical protein